MYLDSCQDLGFHGRQDHEDVVEEVKRALVESNLFDPGTFGQVRGSESAINELLGSLRKQNG